MLRQKIAIKSARFHSAIGFYEEERILGNEFFVDLEVCYTVGSSDSDELDDTLNYEYLYGVLRDVMGKERKLLESAAQEILGKVKSEHQYVQSILVEIRKSHPPFGGDASIASVALEYNKNDN